MKYIVYLTINKKNKHIYVGVHGTTTDKFDGYIGCGVYENRPGTYKYSKTVFQLAVNKYGPDSFIRITLQEFDNEKDAYNFEKQIVNESFLKRRDVYNTTLGGLGGDRGIMSKCLYQYDINGNYIREFESNYEASRIMNIPSSTLSSARKGHWATNGFYYSHYKVDKLDFREYNISTTNKKVYQYNDKGEFEKEFNSCTEAAASLGREATAISRAIKAQYKICDKYFLYTHEGNYSVSKNKYVKNQTVHQYSLDGDYIKSYNNKAEAIKSLGLKSDRIGNAIKTGHSFAGYQWSYEKIEQMPSMLKGKNNKPKKVAQYNLNGELVKIYDSISKCRKDFPGCVRVLYNERVKTHEYLFKFID